MPKKKRGIEHREVVGDLSDVVLSLLEIEEAVEREEGREADWFDYVAYTALEAAKAVLADPAIKGRDDLRRIASKMIEHYQKARSAIPDRAHEAAHHGFLVGKLFVMLTREYQLGAGTRTSLEDYRWSLVSDDDIRSVISNPNYPVREDQAKKLGMSVRQLQRRLKIMG